MIQQRGSRTGLAQQLERAKGADKQRRSLINELNFTYGRLLRLLPAIITRADQDPIRDVLSEQVLLDRRIVERLGAAAAAHGVPPQPCGGGEANALMEEVRYADRSMADKRARATAVVGSLKEVRLHLIQTWGKLIDSLEATTELAFRAEALALQQLEAEIYRALAALDVHLDQAVPIGSRQGA